MKALKIAWHEYLVSIKRKEFLLVTIGLPLLMFGIFLLLMYTMGEFLGKQAATVGYVDHTGLFGNMSGPPGTNLTQYANEGEAKAAFLAGKIPNYFVIPANYMQLGAVNVYRSSQDILSETKADWIGDSMRKKLLEGKLESGIYVRATSPATLMPIFLDKDGHEAELNLLKIAIPYIFAFVFMMSVFITSGFLLQSVVSEKESRVIEVLLSSVSPFDLMAGKIIGLGAVGLTQIAIWVVAGATAFAAFSPMLQELAPVLGAFEIPYTTIVLSLLYFILGYLIFACIYAGVGAISTSQREGQQVAGFFGFIAILPLMFGGAITKEPNSLLAQVLSFFPLTAPVVMLMRLSLAEMSPLEIGGSLLVLILFVIGLMYLSAKLFRMGLLMYGKRPSLGEIIRTMQES
jgi:ABC-2 type transport system permease protein